MGIRAGRADGGAESFDSDDVLDEVEYLGEISGMLESSYPG
jgi:hypothetical protein